MTTYLVVNPQGLNVRSQPSTNHNATILRKMSQGEAFQTLELFYIGNQLWARLTAHTTRSNEYCCITYANREPFAIPADDDDPNTDTWTIALDQWARSLGYNGPKP